MKNFEQIRAKNALSQKDTIGKAVGGGKNPHKKVPVLILQNGLIAAAAFSLEKGEGFKHVFNAVIAHLSDVKLYNESDKSLEGFIKFLTQKSCSQSDFRLITAETMAYLSYLRRFVKVDKK